MRSREFVQSGSVSTRIWAVDGLRAVAIVAVLLFHYGGQLSGGFLGVDIFLVISGFVITRLIALQWRRSGTFSFRGFLSRRIRRLFPPLIAMLLGTSAAAWVFLGSDDFRQYSGSLATSALAASNIFFWRTTGYFAPAASDQPLLHTWSLGLEEQFYLVFPLLLLLLLRHLSLRGVIVGVLFLATCSFGLAVVAGQVAPVANFYLLPTRAWEFLAGATVALAPRKLDGGGSRTKLVPVLGGLLIVGSLIFLDETVVHPGLFTMAPVIGTMCVLHFSEGSGPVQTVLRSRPLVYLGWISYSLYLWHAPVGFVSEHLGFPTSSAAGFVLSVGASLLLAVASFLFIERRSQQAHVKKKVLGGVTAGVVGISLFGYAGWLSSGFAFPSPEPTQVEKLSISLPDSGSQIMLMGDSHGADLLVGLEAIGLNKIADRTSPGCIGLLGVDRYDSRFTPGDCVRKNRSALEEFSQNNNLELLIVLNMGPIYLGAPGMMGQDDARLIGQEVVSTEHPEIVDPYDILEQGLRDTFEFLATKNQRSVIYVLDWPELGIADGCDGREAKRLKIGNWVVLEDHRSREILAPDRCFLATESFVERTERYEELVRRIAADHEFVYVFDASEAVCDETRCVGYRQDVGYLYRDADHLRHPGGSLFVASQLADFMRESPILGRYALR